MPIEGWLKEMHEFIVAIYNENSCYGNGQPASVNDGKSPLVLLNEIETKLIGQIRLLDSIDNHPNERGKDKKDRFVYNAEDEQRKDWKATRREKEQTAEREAAEIAKQEQINKREKPVEKTGKVHKNRSQKPSLKKKEVKVELSTEEKDNLKYFGNIE